MNVKCEYCGAIIGENDEKCYRCGTVNHYFQRKNKEPKTIEDLKDWYRYNNLPNETITRFFIGRDYKFQEAYGIYKDNATGDIVIYENKLGGERVIHYSGKDETYAVEKYFTNLREKTSDPKERKRYEKVSKSIRRPITWKEFCVFIIISLLVIIGFNSIGFLHKKLFVPQNGYYLCENEYYYYYRESGYWFWYDNHFGWQQVKAPKELEKNSNDYFKSSVYDSKLGIDNFEDSGYYVTRSKKSSWNSNEWDIENLVKK